MAFHNANFQILPLTGGTYSLGELGDGLTASTVHQIYCLTSGSIDITAIGGGTSTFIMTAGQTVNVLVAGVKITSGTYVGFKAKFNTSSGTQIQWGNNL